MNAKFFIKAFAWIAIVGLCCMIFLDYWVPILVGVATLTFLVLAVSSKKPDQE